MAANELALVAVATHLLQELTQEDEKTDFVVAVLIPAVLATQREKKPRISNYAEHVIPEYNVLDFRRLFRMSSETFDKISDYLKNCNELKVKGVGREAISVSKQMQITLWYLGSLDTIQRIADRFGVSESSVILSKSRIINALIEMKSKFIKWPNNDELDHVTRCFSQRNGFPGSIGVLDGTHIKIKAPVENQQIYVNRKKFHSIQLQAVCNENMMFIDCFVGPPGSWHDARVLKNSDLWDDGLQLCGFENHVLADAAYPLRRWIMTPYRDNGHLTNEQKNFSFLLSANRSVIERAFGLLKGRFRRLQYLDTKSVEDSVKTIMTCCVLHNICLIHNDQCDDFLIADENIFHRIQPHIVIENECEGVLKRDRILRLLNAH